ncbi:hypothetical protein HNY73_009521 [Argiope bruennichi]|uniref:Uncharacterized protein n=1 Tax=Argiope bruennichi TaxID=94029 RepID=A0A8T0FCJ1_ARGBR|nr:hypothetical protein HNY73_009521 [Argiope bruennichi]
MRRRSTEYQLRLPAPCPGTTQAGRNRILAVEDWCEDVEGQINRREPGRARRIRAGTRRGPDCKWECRMPDVAHGKRSPHI